jgi:hypothetical protein
VKEKVVTIGIKEVRNILKFVMFYLLIM